MSKHYDINAFKNLLTITLKENPNSYVVEELFRVFPSIKELMNLTELELLNIKGIGPNKAKQIAAALQLARMIQLPEQSPPIINNPQAAFDVVREMQFLDREHFVVLGLNTKNQLILNETISIGSLSSSIVHPRETFKILIRFSCAVSILVHNHPSGIPLPSSEDISITKRLIEAGELLGIKIVDHIIVGCNQYYSMKEHDHF